MRCACAKAHTEIQHISFVDLVRRRRVKCFSFVIFSLYFANHLICFVCPEMKLKEKANTENGKNQCLHYAKANERTHADSVVDLFLHKGKFASFLSGLGNGFWVGQKVAI